MQLKKIEWKNKLNEERADRRKMQPTLGVCARMSKTLFRHRHRAPSSNNFPMPVIKSLDFTPLNPLISLDLYIYSVLRVCVHLVNAYMEIIYVPKRFYRYKQREMRKRI
uniref:Uncharacterized protein n=1 Tax=Trichogramma kaykai TaxID=54128 RepID=A0ABD2X5W9_9HYME